MTDISAQLLSPRLTFTIAYLSTIYAYQYVVVIPLSLLAKNEGQSLMHETLQVLIEQHATIDTAVPLSMLYSAVGCHEISNIGMYRFNRASPRLEDCQ